MIRNINTYTANLEKTVRYSTFISMELSKSVKHTIVEIMSANAKMVINLEHNLKLPS